MAKKNETGHDKNVANFKSLIEFVKGYEKYKPSVETNKLTFLEPLLAEAKNVTLALDAKKTIFDNAVNRRMEIFEPLQKLSTRLVASYSLVATDADLADVVAHDRKMKGIRAIKKDKPRPKPAEGLQAEGDQQEDTERSISVSQRSYDSLVRHFGKMIERLEKNLKYKPNEEDLSVASVKALHAEMEAKNDAVKAVTSAYVNAMETHKKVLYQPEIGLKDAADSTKKYVLSVYGFRSPQHRQVLRLVFTEPRKK